jgi:hypothetical protein
MKIRAITLRNVRRFQGETARIAGIEDGITTTLLCKSRLGLISPFPERTHPMASVTGMPSAVKRFRMVTLTWSSAT